jgi:hypothetical protein
LLATIKTDDGQEHVRRVGLESSTAEGGVWAVLGDLPSALARLEELVDGGGSINHVGDPGVPIVERSIYRLVFQRFR